MNANGPPIQDLCHAIEAHFDLAQDEKPLLREVLESAGMDSERCTVGQAREVVWNRVRDRLRVRPPLRKCFAEAMTALAEVSGRARPSIQPETRLEDLLPPRTRRPAWKALRRRLDYPLPALGISTGAVFAIIILAVVSTMLIYRWSDQSPTVNRMERGTLAIVMLALTVGSIELFRRFRGRTIPEPYETVAALVSQIAFDPKRSSPPVPWTPAAVWSHLCRVIAEETGISPRRIRPEQRLVADLGARPPVCRQCGYDLRGCWPRCPECGEVDG